MVTYADANLLQMFLLKRFRALSPITVEFKAVKPRMVDGVEKVKVPPKVSRVEVVWGYLAEGAKEATQQHKRKRRQLQLSPICLHTSVGHAESFLCSVEQGGFVGASTEHAGWHPISSGHDRANFTPIEVGEWGVYDYLQPPAYA